MERKKLGIIIMVLAVIGTVLYFTLSKEPTFATVIGSTSVSITLEYKPEQKWDSGYTRLEYDIEEVPVFDIKITLRALDPNDISNQNHQYVIKHVTIRYDVGSSWYNAYHKGSKVTLFDGDISGESTWVSSWYEVQNQVGVFAWLLSAGSVKL